MTPARGMAVAYTPLLAGATWAMVARLLGGGVPLAVVIVAAVWLAVAAALAAGLAVHALVRRRWAWAAGLLAAWPVVVPVYLWRVSPT